MSDPIVVNGLAAMERLDTVVAQRLPVASRHARSIGSHSGLDDPRRNLGRPAEALGRRSGFRATCCGSAALPSDAPTGEE